MTFSFSELRPTFVELPATRIMHGIDEPVGRNQAELFFL